MANNFEIVGKLSIGKESEKFTPYEERSFPSGWGKARLLFNVQAAENRHMLTSEGMYKEDGTGIIHSFTKGSVDEKTHERIKGEKIQIPWKDRHKSETLEKIAEFKKYIVDLEKYGRRYELQDALKKQEEGTLTDEELQSLGVTDLAQALEDSKKKRKEFISEYDYAVYLNKLIKSDKLKDKVFKVLGEIVYNESNGKIYKKLVPSRIYLVDDKEDQTSTAQVTVFYNKESLDENSYEDSKKYYLNGFVRNYDGQRKMDISFPVQLVIDDSKEDEKVQKFNKLLASQFTVDDDSWKEFGVKVKLLDGAQKAEITEDMMSDFQKQMLELDMMTLDEIKAEIRKETGGEIYGDKVQEMVVVNVAKGSSKGRKDTVYVDSDFVIQPIVKEETPNEVLSESDEEDMFSDLDDLDI